MKKGILRSGGWKGVVLAASLSGGGWGVPVGAVIFYETGDAHHNTTAPEGELAGSGWQWQGDAFPGVPIARNFFITATHVGGKVGDSFSFQGQLFPMIAAFAHPEADITLWQVSGSFPEFAPLYATPDEVGKRLVVFGSGNVRGEEVWLNGRLKGWTWGPADGLLRWGENVVAGISDGTGRPATAETGFQLLRADFDAAGGRNEAHLSGGDSGGSVFIREGDVWKLAGINHAANKEYSEAETGAAFSASLFDEGGYYEGEAGQREFHPEDPTDPQPGSFYATRISAYISWIESVIQRANENPGATVTLQEAASLFGPYTPVSGESHDPAQKIIRIPQPSGTRFYRLASDVPYLIREITRDGNGVVVAYE